MIKPNYLAKAKNVSITASELLQCKLSVTVVTLLVSTVHSVRAYLVAALDQSVIVLVHLESSIPSTSLVYKERNIVLSLHEGEVANFATK